MFDSRYIEWDIPDSEVQVDTPVGYEVELALYSDFRPVIYRLTTFEENVSLAARFFYSLDDGESWVSYPSGESGYVFDQAHKIRLEVQEPRAGFIIASDGQTIYQIRPDADEILQSFSIPDVNEVDSIVAGDEYVGFLADKTLYRYDVNGLNISPYDWSLNLLTDPIDVEVDYARRTFWQIDNDRICLKDEYGQEVSCIELDYWIDNDMSSSSSSVQYSSSSSLQYSSSSSSS